ncbi:MAG: translation initiation factor IF-2 [Prevotellaceae bacterium]|jgi:translation initiation factor IF-2|nr:translation initiation factor IF-2 [Prevotellaceae bacterium]
MVQNNIRISKILKDFNVGMTTVVEFLKKKGIDVEANPNGKVSEEIYDLAKNEFGKEHDLKEKSKKINPKPENINIISVSDIEKEEDIEEPDEPVIFVKTNTVDIPIEFGNLPGPKIIGKLSDEQLSGRTNRTKAPEQKTQESKTQESVDHKKVTEKIERTESPKAEETPKTEEVITAKQSVGGLKSPEIIGKIDIDSISKPKRPDKSKLQDKPDKYKPQDRPDKQKPQDRQDRPKPQDGQDKYKPQDRQDRPKPQGGQDKYKPQDRQDRPKPQDGQDKYKPQDRPDRPKPQGGQDRYKPQDRQDRPKPQDGQDKYKPQDGQDRQDGYKPHDRQKQREQSPENYKKKPEMQVPLQIDNQENVAPDSTNIVEIKTEPEFIKTQVKTLSGPNVVGKIDLSQFAKKPPVPVENKVKDFKKKRQRIKKDGKVNVAAEINARKDNTPKDRPKDVRFKNDKKKLPEKPKPIHRPVDDDAVQRQVKDTLARLTAGKGKTKSSKYRREKRDAVSHKATVERELLKQESNILKVTEFVTVNELATLMNVPVVKVIEACMNLGLMVSINQRLDAEALVLVAEEFGYTVEFVTAELQDSIEEEMDKEEDLVPRPPIITVMGHVDHGKTSLLDNIRKTNVIADEAGGITQHIGAYSVKMDDGRRITFLDTPGHEAFTAMRARGAKITDVAIIIVAADDAVMPQTVEAINHAVAAGVPMIFAINKIDKPGANPDKIREQLANMHYLLEEWGGKYQSQEIAAKQGLNVDKLLEKVLLEADLLDLKANPNKKAVGTVIESSLDKGRGYVTTLLVHNGTLKIGDVVLSGTYTGRVKAMFNERGKRLEKAGPSTPVLMLGLNGAPTAGETFNVMNDDKEAREIANKREQLIRIQDIRTRKHITLEEIGRRIAIGSFKELNIVVKTDVDGSMEALSDSLIKLSTEEVQVNIIHKAVGAISESDVLLAAASNAIIVGFQVRPSANARKLAEKEEIEIRLYSVIYDAINEVRDGIEGMLAPELKEEITSTVEVLEIFKITKVGTVAGCIVREGKITRNSRIRLIRDGIVIYTGSLGSLKRFKEDAKEVLSGYDCGLNIENFNDVKIGDFIESYEEVEVKRKL